MKRNVSVKESLFATQTVQKIKKSKHIICLWESTIKMGLILMYCEVKVLCRQFGAPLPSIVCRGVHCCFWWRLSLCQLSSVCYSANHFLTEKKLRAHIDNSLGRTDVSREVVTLLGEESYGKKDCKALDDSPQDAMPFVPVGLFLELSFLPFCT